MRHTRWFHLRVIGDQQLARRYIPAVRTVLGQLTTRAQLGLLGVAGHTEQIAEGVILKVQLIEGRVIATMYVGIALEPTEETEISHTGFVCMPISFDYPTPYGVSNSLDKRPDSLFGLSVRGRPWNREYSYKPFYYNVDHFPDPDTPDPNSPSPGVYGPVGEDYEGLHTAISYPTLYGGNCDWVGHEADQLACSWLRTRGRYSEGVIGLSSTAVQTRIYFRGALIVTTSTIYDTVTTVGSTYTMLGAGMRLMSGQLYLFAVFGLNSGFSGDSDVTIKLVRWEVVSDETLGYVVQNGFTVKTWTQDDLEHDPDPDIAFDLRGSVLAFNASCTRARMSSLRVNARPQAYFDLNLDNPDDPTLIYGVPEISEEQYELYPDRIISFPALYDDGLYFGYLEWGTPDRGGEGHVENIIGYDFVGDEMVTVRLRHEYEFTATQSAPIYEVHNTAAGHTYSSSMQYASNETHRLYMYFEYENGRLETYQLEDYSIVTTRHLDWDQTYTQTDGVIPQVRTYSGSSSDIRVDHRTWDRKRIMLMDARTNTVVYVRSVGHYNNDLSIERIGPWIQYVYPDSSLNTLDRNDYVTTTVVQDYEATWTWCLSIDGTVKEVATETFSEASEDVDSELDFWFIAPSTSRPVSISTSYGVLPNVSPTGVYFEDVEDPALLADVDSPAPQNSSYGPQMFDGVTWVIRNNTHVFEDEEGGYYLNDHGTLFTTYSIQHPALTTFTFYCGYSAEMHKGAIMLSIPAGLYFTEWRTYLTKDEDATVISGVSGIIPDLNSFFPIWTLYDRPGQI
jgi:hypothetical protein